MCYLKQLYLIICSSICFSATAQTLQFDNYTTKDGLISDEVYKIFQDRKGYIWLFTNYGTMKYNGKKFEQVLKNIPFSESFIYSFYENKHGQKWIANSNAKIYEIRNDSAFLINGTERISEKLKEDVCEISELFVDDDTNIYITTKNGAYKLVKDKNYISSSVKENSNADSAFIYVLDFGDKIVSSINNRFRNSKTILGSFSFNIKYVNVNNPNSSFKVKVKGKSNTFNPTYFKRFKNDIYFLFYDNIIKIEHHKFIKHITIPSFILNYTKDKNNHLWIGTLNNGLYELNEKDSIINHYLSGKTINHVLIDSQNGLWASSDGSGLFHCKNLNETHFGDYDLLGNGINFIKKIDNKLFLANSIGDISIFDNNRIINIQSIGREKSEVLDIIKNSSGYIICYRFQLEFLEIKNKIRIIKLPVIKPAFYPIKLFNINEDSILCIARNRILILNKGIVNLNKEKENQIINLDHKIFSYEPRNNVRLFGTEDGVYKLIGNKLIQPNYLEPTRNCKVVKITRDAFNNFWFCTKGYGLFKLTNENEIIHYTVDCGLPSNVINDISFNTDNSILLSTNKGLFQSSKFKKWIEIYPEQVQSAIGFKNDIYFTTKDGLIIHTDSKLIEQHPIYFNLASVLVNSNTISVQQIDRLNYDQNSFVFNFDIISFSSNIPDIIYQLSGEKKNTAVTNNQQVIFQNLAPGNYTLTASLVAQHNKSIPIIIPFCINPAFWQTTWFMTSCIFGCLLLCIYLGWKIFKYYRNKENKRNEAKRLITEYKLIALKAQINPHFMSNCLTAIQHLIISGKVDEANQYLAKFSLLVRQVLNFSSKPLVTLKEELEIAVINIELEQLRFENKFLFVTVLDNKIDGNTVFVPPLILQPIIENAIWHGLLPLKKARHGKLMIEIKAEENLLSINIEDNGVGRKKEGEGIGNLKDSKGIAITKQRIQNLNEFYNNNEADLAYADLFDDDINAIGTRVTIILPLNLKQK